MIEKFQNIKPVSQPNENREKLNLVTEIAKEEDWEKYKDIRLEAIEKEPVAFYVTKESKEREYGKTNDDWKNDLTNIDAFVVLSKNNDIPVGMAQAFLKTGTGNKWNILKKQNKNIWHIKGVYLNNDYRGSGFSKEMMDMIFNEIKRRGGEKVTLNVMDTQEIAKKIYEKLGFKVFKKFKSKIIDGLEYPSGQWMEKDI